MKLISNLSKETTNLQVKQAIDEESPATIDMANNHKDLAKYPTVHKVVVAGDKKENGRTLFWVHLAISNAKRLLVDIPNSIREQHLQNYMDGLCYKFNKKYFNSIFDRVVNSSLSPK